MFKRLSRQCTAFALAGACLASPVGASTVYSESVSGDLSDTQAGAVTLQLDIGSNVILGSIAPTEVNYSDWFIFELDGNERIDQVALLSYTDSHGNALATPDLSQPQSTASKSLASGVRIFGPTDMSTNYTTGVGVIGSADQWSIYTGADPLVLAVLNGPGQFAVQVIDGTNFANYALDFQVSAVPLPAAFLLFGSAMGVFGYLGWRRRKQLA